MRKILLIGGGGLTIGQAGEFDYSGSQALRAFVEEGFEVVVVNPNIATVQTNPKENCVVYLYPLTSHWVEKIIQKEQPECIAASFGGQSAIKCLLDLERNGVLEKHNVRIVGPKPDVLYSTEDRGAFAEKMHEINTPVAFGRTAHSASDAVAIAAELGFPVMVRAAYTLGGLGSGVCHNMDELSDLLAKAFTQTTQVIVEKSLFGQLELEYEVMRDTYGNSLVVCNMENLDPVGIHTGDSIVMAPSQTIDDDIYQTLRSKSLEIADHLGIVGECNVQYAVDPETREYTVIEVNARLSRSSALASKATGYPIAYLTAKIILGHNLIELKNPMAKTCSAFFEPSMDYITVKIPRWDLDKFSGANREISSKMKSIGEVMAIGRSFPEAFQKALRMVGENEIGLLKEVFSNVTDDELLAEVSKPTDRRIFAVYEALKRGFSPEELNRRSSISLWCINQLSSIHKVESEICTAFKKMKSSFSEITSKYNKAALFSYLRETLMFEQVLKWKQYGFSDHQIVKVMNQATGELYTDDIETLASTFRETRKALNVYPKIKKIDTTAGEFPTDNNYLFMTYHGVENDIEALTQEDSPICVLGSGTYRIGSSVEFD